MTKEEIKEYNKVYYQMHKEEHKAYYQEHKEKYKTIKKAWYEANKEKCKVSKKADTNSLGQTKKSIRYESGCILKRMNMKISGYEIHHCFGYEDASKFIYCSKSLHLKIHQYLRDNKISADINHWMAIRDIVNATDEFTFIKC